MTAWKQLFTCFACGLTTLGVATEISAQGFGSFVDVPRNGGASPVIRRGPPIRDDLPIAVQSALGILASLRASSITPESTLADFVIQLNRLGIPTILDKHSLEDEGVSPSDVVQMPAASLSLGQGLKHALGEFGCIWTMDARGTLLILSRATEEELLMNISYDVTGLLSQGDYDALIRVITSTVDPDSWDDVGGPGTVKAAPVGSHDLLVVSNSLHVQLEIRRLLNSLARMSTASTSSLPGGTLQRTRPPERIGVGRTGSSVIAMPSRSERRGIALPNQAGDASTSAFGGGMMGGMGGMAGGMF